MNILILHNAYQQPGGEDAVVAAESALLRGAGHKVRVETVSNHAISGFAAKAATFLAAPYNPTRKKWLAALVDRERPDLVHIHNFFPLLTPAIHEAAAEMGLPVVQTLHNYRLVCANAQLLRNGSVCEKCLAGNRLWGVAHRCYRGSLPGSLAVVRMQERAFRAGTWHSHVHRFIALTAFARQKFVASGLPADRIAVKPNVVARISAPADARHGALFVGRLSPEKGVETLIKAWEQLPMFPLTIAGNGPELERMRALAPANVTFTVAQTPGEIALHMAKAQALIVPSLWYEGFPMVVAEAFAAGLPVIASNIGSLAEIVVPGRNGAHFVPGDAQDLVATVEALLANPATLQRLAVGARASYETHYTPETSLAQLERIYADAIEAARTA